MYVFFIIAHGGFYCVANGSVFASFVRIKKKKNSRKPGSPIRRTRRG